MRIPDDINAEELLSLFPDGTCKVAMKGTHKRNSYNDIVALEEKADGTLRIDIGRKSLYQVLPEYVFHPTDRFSALREREKVERFKEEYDAQEREKEDAFRFFAPVDLLLLSLRLEAREGLRSCTETGSVLQQLLGDALTDEQKRNRFIRQAVRLFPSFKYIRGDRTLITLLLRKVFMEEGVSMDVCSVAMNFRDDASGYGHRVDDCLDACYVGNEFQETVLAYVVRYWSDTACDDRFPLFVEEVEVFRSFVQDYLMSVEGVLRFDISKDEEPLRLSDDLHYNYLNYNTNL